jgi:hypothetical protein
LKELLTAFIHHDRFVEALLDHAAKSGLMRKSSVTPGELVDHWTPGPFVLCIAP